MPTFGVYKAVDGYSAGDEVSSTYEGRHITVLESEITHPSHADALVNKGDPVVVGNQIVGVAFESAAAATDLIAIDAEGIWGLSVVGSDDSGNSAVAGGDLLYINTTTCMISKITDITTQIPFGFAMGVVGAGVTGVIAVKVHFDPANQNDVPQCKEVSFTEDGAGVYTGSINLPGGATILNVIVHAVALWTAGTSAAMIVGDATDPNGFFDAINLKATDLLAGEGIDFAHTGGKEGADVDAPAAAVHVRRRYLAAARVVSGEITSVGAGTAGRTRMTVCYTVPVVVVEATKA